MTYARNLINAAALIALLGVSFAAQAYDADWKRGRVYYRSVCTSCHIAAPIGAINPSTKTKADWTAYLITDKHAKGKDTVSQYVSQELPCQHQGHQQGRGEVRRNPGPGIGR